MTCQEGESVVLMDYTLISDLPHWLCLVLSWKSDLRRRRKKKKKEAGAELLRVPLVQWFSSVSSAFRVKRRRLFLLPLSFRRQTFPFGPRCPRKNYLCKCLESDHSGEVVAHVMQGDGNPFCSVIWHGDKISGRRVFALPGGELFIFT